MQRVLRSVSARDATIRFGGRVNDKALRDFVPVLYDVVSRHPPEIVIDLRRAQRAYADAVLPIACLVDHRRQRGDSFRVLLPETSWLRQLFLNANWAHFLDPQYARVDLDHPQHLPTRRYVNHPEQQAAVSAAMDVVLRNMDLTRGAIGALEWTINEITDNVLNHAQSAGGGLVHLSTYREEHKIEFVVADAGRGIPQAMREAFPSIHDDVTAISEAVRSGVTSTPNSGQGNGLTGTLRLAAASQGAVKICSGKAQLSLFPDNGGRYEAMTRREPGAFRFPGTLVMTRLSTVAEVDVGAALGLTGPTTGLLDVVDTRYSDEQGDLFLVVAEEALGVGTRHAGAELRRKVLNLLGAEPAKRLVLDWRDVPLVASSFADEAIGKLFVELGPTRFSGRVSHANAEPLVQSLLDKAVMQRVAQVMVSEASREASAERS